MRQPDPKRNIEGDAGYARHYVATHEQTTVGLPYRLEYSDLCILDSLLDEGYALLDVGCGTAGYHRLLKRHGRVVGLDFSSEMIAAAKELAVRFETRNCDYVAGTWEDYRPPEPFDGIAFASIYGWYRSWRGAQDVMNRLAGMLKPDGLLILSYVHPTTPFNWLKAWCLGERTMCLPESEFRAMLAKAGLKEVLTLNKPHTRVCFAQKTATG